MSENGKYEDLKFNLTFIDRNTAAVRKIRFEGIIMDKYINSRTAQS
jgi:hypothetical protein